MASATATVTGKTGPAGQLTALPLTNIKDIEFDFEHYMITIKHGDPTKNLHVSWSGVTVTTFTITAGNAVVVIS